MGFEVEGVTGVGVVLGAVSDMVKGSEGANGMGRSA
jgi:hypothetical protein